MTGAAIDAAAGRGNAAARRNIPTCPFEGHRSGQYPPALPLSESSRATQSQGHLRFRERHKNVKRAFAVHPKRAESLRGKNIVLVDDVYTTGATVKECTKALLEAGAAEVNVLTVTRVLRPDGAN